VFCGEINLKQLKMSEYKENIGCAAIILAIGMAAFLVILALKIKF